MVKAKLARVYELMKDPDYPIDLTREALIEEKANLPIQAEITSASANMVAVWTVDHYQEGPT